MKSLLDWTATAAAAAAKVITESTEVKAWYGSSALQTSQLMTSKNVALCKVGARQSSQLLRISLAFRMYALRDGRVRELLFHVVGENMFHAILRKSARVLWLVLDVAQHYLKNEKSHARLCNGQKNDIFTIPITWRAIVTNVRKWIDDPVESSSGLRFCFLPSFLPTLEKVMVLPPPWSYILDIDSTVQWVPNQQYISLI